MKCENMEKQGLANGMVLRNATEVVYGSKKIKKRFEVLPSSLLQL